MSAIEYGSYYWCVILNGKRPNVPGESVHLHVDEMSIDPNGALTFKSAGRRPSGGEPPHANGKEKGDDKKSDKKDDQKNQDNKTPGMIYVGFAPGTWRVVYAAKLIDGSPASIEHWASEAGNADVPLLTPTHAGAAGQPNMRE
jgi:hypothetical protein